ncbi:fibrillin-2-like [Macrobrachium nipponense]|uniref:fibrillin-2-like n=1 Tax=Macrobrachium nipponense TaxID=159736 RepID=UPI0030C88D29
MNIAPTSQGVTPVQTQVIVTSNVNFSKFLITLSDGTATPLPAPLLWCVPHNKCDSNPCGSNSHCQTTPGSYECVCNDGYEKVNGNCVDINECDSGNNACLSNEDCTNVPGSYTCTNRCGPGLTYLPVNDRCGKLLSGNMTYDEGRTMCFKISLYEGDINSKAEVNGYGEAFLPNVGDIAWIHSVPFSVLDKCETLTKANSTSYVVGNLDCNVKMNAIICDSVGGV